MVLEVIELTRENFQNEVQESAVKRDWRKIIKLSQKYGFKISTVLLWAFPTEHCLQELKLTFKKYNITNILSIGCGIGLLEFIIRESVGSRISGLEIDKNYWKNKKPFIPITYTEHDQEVTTKLLLDSSVHRSWNFSLLFCYFNLRHAFDEYIKSYRGNYVIIIGPSPKAQRYTDPLPLDFKYNEDFQLVHCSDFGDNHDLLAIYERKVKSFAV
ncbi:hypothetical protein PVAND_000761 [Polypedilum vanderplanki]|uniref:Uncharacterized protein n=1 Tax=Polypedilum vanderplanki TaxID=319348 RepID=A0A9J6BM86_POLVA|nr:hypothetical protein PVAND_000761 [Polypedilum vanderplanki]